MDENIKQFLLEQTNSTPHSDRTLYDHLRGTYDLLKEWDADDFVCKAGLFHSIYGTDSFLHQTVTLDQRYKIIEMIGPEAERLAFIFCSCFRPYLVDAAMKGSPYQVISRRDFIVIPLSAVDLSNLLLIEMANLLEQGGGPMLSKVSEALNRVKS